MGIFLDFVSATMDGGASDFRHMDVPMNVRILKRYPLRLPLTCSHDYIILHTFFSIVLPKFSILWYKYHRGFI